MTQSELARLVREADIIVTAGSGGVGKTTTAAVLALEGARAGRRQHKVARRHHGLLAVDLGVGALAVEDEADGSWAVAVRRGDLARQDEL